MAEPLTEEQVQELQSKVAAFEEEKKGLVPKSELEKLSKEFEEKEKGLMEQINPNWKKTHDIINSLKKIAKSKGVEVDDEGNVVNNPNNVDMEKVRLEATNAATGALVSSKLEDILGQYDDESAALVRQAYEKLTAGVTVTLKNIQGFVTQAEGAARAVAEDGGKKFQKVVSYSGGQGPRVQSQGHEHDAAADDLAGLMGLKLKGSEQK